MASLWMVKSQECSDKKAEREKLRAEGRKITKLAERTPEDATKLAEILGGVESLDGEITALEGTLAQMERERELLRSENVTVHAEPREHETFASLGEQLLAVRNASVAGGSVDRRLYQALPLGSNVGLPSEGGYLLQTDYAAGIWQRVYNQGQVLPRCFKVPIGANADSVKINQLDESSRAAGSRWGGVRSYWVAEAGTLTASLPKFRQLELAPKKEAVLLYATSEMLRNAATLEAIVNQIVPQEIAYLAEDAVFNGDGAGKPLGIGASAVHITVAKETNQVAASLMAENFSKMWGRLDPRSKSSAVWFVGGDCGPQLDMLAIPVGLGGMAAPFVAYGPDGTLRIKGRPVFEVEYCAAVGTEGDVVLADLSQYATSDRGTTRADSSIHVQFLTDQTAFRFIYEIDGAPLWASPLTPANGGATTSPFINLAVRA